KVKTIQDRYAGTFECRISAGCLKWAPCGIRILLINKTAKSLERFNLLSFSSIILCSSVRIFFSRSALLAKALGTTPEEEHRMGMHKLAKLIESQVGILFTDTEPQDSEVIE
ncbi:hypothetical protein BT96DRAFT_1052022, partial [Gymnopus androsaceus JB14]